MLNNLNIRLASAEDTAQILQLYAPFITQTVITFECRIPEEDEFSQRIEKIQQKYPWLVCEANGSIIGYAYAASFNEREAYNWSATCSVYVNPQYHGRKIGKALYSALFELLKMQGYFNVYAIVTLPNTKSEKIHESFGFETAGYFKNSGYKFDNWRDVKYYSLNIKDHTHAPERPKSIGEIENTDEFREVIEKAEKMILTE